MIRVYLDWNIFSYLKTFKESKEPYTSLNKNLESNSDKILIPYTSAHLSDLAVSYNHSEKGKKETENDLKYLAKLTNNHCIIYDHKSKLTHPEVYDVCDYFQQILEGEILVNETFTNLLSPLQNADFGQSVNLILKLLENTPSLAKKDTLENIPSKYKILKDAIDGEHMLDSLNKFWRFMSQMRENPKVYRTLRNSSLEDLKLTHDYSEEENPISRIGYNLSKSAMKLSFAELAKQIEELYFKDKNSTRVDTFTTYYFLLDFLGYYKDRVLRNLIQDSFHAYYGAHCNFFITDDDNTYNKAKVLYEHFNISTVVCKSHEFNSEFYGKVILNTHNEKSLSKIISDVIDSSFVISGQHGSNFNPADIYRIDNYIFNYFNRLQVTREVNRCTTFFLYKATKNYSDFYFFKEIESVVNRVSLEFGRDQNSRLEYMPELENQELLNESWPGRKWYFEELFIDLNILEAPFGLTLMIESV